MRPGEIRQHIRIIAVVQMWVFLLGAVALGFVAVVAAVNHEFWMSLTYASLSLTWFIISNLARCNRNKFRDLETY